MTAISKHKIKNDFMKNIVRGEILGCLYSLLNQESLRLYC